VVTGRYPIDHGVDNNLLLQPQREVMDWYWDHNYISGDTIFKNAHKKDIQLHPFLGLFLEKWK